MALLLACLFCGISAGCIVNPVPTPGAPTSLAADRRDPETNTKQDSHINGSEDASSQDVQAYPGAADGYSSSDSAIADASLDTGALDIPDAQTPVDASRSVTSDSDGELACDGGCG